MGFLSLGTNLIARDVQRSTNVVTDNLRRVSERLASGQRINRASDDAAGLAVSTSLFAQGRIYTQALRNGNDAISALSIADGSLEDMTSILTRMRELAVQSANGTFTATQRRSIDREAQSLAAEFQRMQATTKFNGIQLVNNSESAVGIQLGSGRFANMNINLGISGTGSTTTTATSNILSDVYSPRAWTGSFSDFGIGDVNNDGMDDLITADYSSGLVTVSLSDGSGFTKSQTVGSYGFTVAGVATGDFNNDGNDDFVIGYTTGHLDIYQSDGSGGATIVNSFELGSLSQVRPVVADMDGDGNLDIVFAKGKNFLTLTGDGYGDFGATVSTKATTNNIIQIAVGQFIGSSEKDLIGYSGGNVELFTGTGTDFSAKTSLNGLGASGAQTAGDIDGDGYDDYIGFTSNSARVFRGNGLGGFTAGAVLTDSLSSPNEAIVGDVNGDGIKDIIVNNGAAQLNYYIGDQAGGYSFWGARLSPISSETFGLVGGDMNGDGFMDAFSSDPLSGPTGVDAYISVVDVANSSSTTSVIALDDFSLLNAVNARNALATIDSAMDKVSQTRGKFGASLSRIGSALNTLQAARENSEAAAGRIMNADIGFEAANYTRLSLLQQTGAALLAQANQLPSLALRLLRD